MGLLRCFAPCLAMAAVDALVKVELTGPARDHGAVCLDGTPGAFYWAPATDVALATTWVIFFQGGGWCYNEEDCAERSKGDLGSSRDWGPNMTQVDYASGIFGGDPDLNPDFAGANHVYLKYCDGNSFSGNRSNVVNNTGTPLYFRGARIVDGLLDTLADNATFGLVDATDVLLSGCSAGGLATILHADHVGARLATLAPNLRRYKAAPCSGFFLDHANAEGISVFREQMQSIFELSNASAGLDESCLAAHSSAEAWRCNMAPYAYAHVESPIMILNSALDAFQLICILAAERAEEGSEGEGNCSASPSFPPGCACYECDIEQLCDAAAFDRFRDYETDFMQAISEVDTYSKSGNSAFIHSCNLHCASSREMFNSIKIANVTMQGAVSEWWNEKEDIEPRKYLPCIWEGPGKKNCNPTCPPPDRTGPHPFLVATVV